MIIKKSVLLKIVTNLEEVLALLELADTELSDSDDLGELDEDDMISDSPEVTNEQLFSDLFDFGIKRHMDAEIRDKLSAFVLADYLRIQPAGEEEDKWLLTCRRVNLRNIPCYISENGLSAEEIFSLVYAAQKIIDKKYAKAAQGDVQSSAENKAFMRKLLNRFYVKEGSLEGFFNLQPVAVGSVKIIKKAP